ncbi:CDP-diacylglycerol--serine O-phosphatidyltransferase [Paenibacillus sp. PK3_47]|nr:CDP-diacylglycerol--serine O-phosphatidyltransferase [Paenibacillus sp. PK3_47]
MLKKNNPNALTYANLSFGFLSILELFNKEYILSAVFILIAAFIDRYDGKIARYLQVTSDIGKELDSLADLVSFGVAPALLIFHKFTYSELGSLKLFGIGILLLYVISGSYRLGRYNTAHYSNGFQGVPITIAGTALALYSLLPNRPINLLISVFILFIFSTLMIAKFRIKKI